MEKHIIPSITTHTVKNKKKQKDRKKNNKEKETKRQKEKQQGKGNRSEKPYRFIYSNIRRIREMFKR
jgi:hypothetical protein